MNTDYNPEQWTADSNEVLKISVADDGGYVSFHPLFTYPIFGDSEQIFGYKGLEINLVFDSITFLPFVKVKYTAKMNDDVEDVEKKLLEFLPESTIVNDEAKWVDTFQKEQKEVDYAKFEVISTYVNKGQEYNIYKLKFSDPFALELNKRLQILVLLFIEAGSYIDTSDELWDLYVSVESKTNKLVSFATTYSYFKYNSAEEFDSQTEIKKRNKISQFIVLPTQQKSQHGSKLYNAIVNYWMQDSSVEEITVEDPNEKFDDLRYRNDFTRLFENGFISSLPKNLDTLNRAWFKTNAAKFKLELNQFKKVVEMGYLYNNSVKMSRLLIKKRLYEKNKDGLLEMEVPVRNDKLQTAHDGIKQDYTRLLDGLRMREDSHVHKKQRV